MLKFNFFKAPFRVGTLVLKWTLFRHASTLDQVFHKQLAKGLDYGEMGDNFGVGASTACENVTMQRALTKLELVQISARAQIFAWAPRVRTGTSLNRG